MNRSQVIEAIVEKTEIAKKDVTAILDAQDTLIGETLKARNPFTLGKIGKIEPVYRKERIAHNPTTGAPINVPAKNTVKLKPSKDLLTAIA